MLSRNAKLYLASVSFLNREKQVKHMDSLTIHRKVHRTEGRLQLWSGVAWGGVAYKLGILNFLVKNPLQANVILSNRKHYFDRFTILLLAQTKVSINLSLF